MEFSHRQGLQMRKMGDTCVKQSQSKSPYEIFAGVSKNWIGFNFGHLIYYFYCKSYEGNKFASFTWYLHNIMQKDMDVYENFCKGLVYLSRLISFIHLKIISSVHLSIR